VHALHHDEQHWRIGRIIHKAVHGCHKLGCQLAHYDHLALNHELGLLRRAIEQPLHSELRTTHARAVENRGKSSRAQLLAERDVAAVARDETLKGSVTSRSMVYGIYILHFAIE